MTALNRRRLAASAVLAAAALGAAACGSSGNQAAANAPVTLTILTHINPPTQQALATLNAAFHKKYPNITVSVDAVDTNNVQSVRNTRMTAKNLDITEVFPFQGAANPSYVKGQPPNLWGQLISAGKFVNLKGQSFLKEWSPSALQTVGEAQGGTYAIPTGRDIVTGLYYNKAIFAQYHLSVPTTWNQLVSVVNTLKAHGVSPFIIGGKDGWTNGMPWIDLMQSLYPTVADKQALDKSLWTGTAAYTDPTNVQVMSELQTIFKNTTPGFAGVTNQQADGLFANGKAAMFPEGSWEAPSILAANPNVQMGYFPMPGSNNAAANDQWGGKYEIGWSILSSSPHRDAALKWMAFYSDPKNYGPFITTAGFIPAEPGISSSSFYNSLNITEQNFSLNYQNIATLPANASQQAGFDYMDLAPLGKDSPTKLAQLEQSAWTKALSNP
ncbi:MAG: extracellular solute-binding protein [Actinobacteria bacterium]|nr:extracellular solute-binding protein [Actinomycetota bacterium]